MKKVGLDVGKYCNIAKSGVFECIIKIPHAKIIRFNFLIGWSIGINAGTIWTKCGTTLGENNTEALLDECRMVWVTIHIGKSGGLKNDLEN